MTNTYSDEPYICITADSHAGASHATYREYLDPKYRDQFDEFRSGRKSGMLPLQSKKHKNWETEVFKDIGEAMEWLQLPVSVVEEAIATFNRHGDQKPFLYQIS